MATKKKQAKPITTVQVGERAWSVMVPADVASALGAPKAAVEAGDHVVVVYFALDPADPEVRAGSGPEMKKGAHKGKRGPLQTRMASVRFYPSVSVAHPRVRIDGGVYVDPRPEGGAFKAFVPESEIVEDDETEVSF